MPVEQFDKLGEVREGAGQPVDLVDDHNIYLACLQVEKQRLQGGTIEGGTRQATVVIMIGNQAPALMSLALDIGLARFPLGIERIELQVEIMLSGFARVDGASGELSCRRHRAARGLRFVVPGRPVSGTAAGSPLFSRKPQNRGPFQLDPVIVRAMVVRLPYVAPLQTKPSSATVTV